MGKRGLEENLDGDENAGIVDPVDSNKPEDLRILEAVLFASDELMTAARLKAILPGQPDARKIRTMVEKINVQLQKERHPFEVVEIGGGYQFRTIAFYHPWVRQLFKEKAVKKLSIQALECLAIIAYKQPLSKAEIEAIRGVVSDGAMKTLLEKRLVTISGRSDKPGKPLLYSTTHTFLTYFGLNKIDDLPRIEEFEALAREKMDELSLEELTEPDMLENEGVPDSDVNETQEDGGDSPLFEVERDAAEKGSGSVEGGAAAEVNRTAPETAASDSDAPVRDLDNVTNGNGDFEVHVDDKAQSADTETGRAGGDADAPQVSEVTTVPEVDIGSPSEKPSGSDDAEPEATVAFEFVEQEGSPAAESGGDTAGEDAASGYSHEDATVFDFDNDAAAAERSSNSDDAVFEVSEQNRGIARFSEDDVEFLGGALMETKAIDPKKLKRKKGKKDSAGLADADQSDGN